MTSRVRCFFLFMLCFSGNLFAQKHILNNKTLGYEKLVSTWDPNSNPEVPMYLSQIRKLLFEGRNADAIKLMQKRQGRDMNMYQPLANVFFK